MKNDLGEIYNFCNFLIDPVVFLDMHGRIKFFNRAVLDLTGYSGDELSGKSAFELVVPEQREDVVKRFRESRKKGIISTPLYEVQIIKKSGERIHLQASCFIFELKDKKYIVVFARDITNLKRLLILSNVNKELLELGLREEKLERFLKKALELLTSLEWISLEKKGAIFLKADGRLRMVAQLNLPELLKTCSTLEMGKCLCGRAALGEEFFTTKLTNEHEITCKGMEEHGHAVVPIKYGDEILGVLNLYTKPRKKLQKFEQEFIRGVANILALVITRFKFIEMFTEATRRLMSIRELDRAIASRTPITNTFDVFASQLRKFLDFDIASIYSFEKDRLELVATKSFIETLESETEIPYEGSLASEALRRRKVIIRIPGDRYPEDRIAKALGVSVYVCAPLVAREKPVGFIYIASRRQIDYSESLPLIEELSAQLTVAIENYQLYKELKEAYEKLKELDELKTNIVVNVKHEILTPVTVIKGVLELLDERIRDEDVKELIATARKYMYRLVDIVEDLVTVSKIYRGEATFNLEMENLGGIVRECVREKEHYAREKQVEIKLQAEKVLVLVDRSAVKKAVLNLIDNAIKFNRRGGKVEVKVFRKVDEAVVEVRDTGIGIPEPMLKELFKPLTQLDPSVRRRYGGTGTGLAVVKSVAEAHKGRVEVESRVGEGSVFRIYLPIARAES